MIFSSFRVYIYFFLPLLLILYFVSPTMQNLKLCFALIGSTIIYIIAMGTSALCLTLGICNLIKLYYRKKLEKK